MPKTEEKVYEAGSALWNEMKGSFEQDLLRHRKTIIQSLKHLQNNHVENLDESFKAASDLIASTNFFLGEVEPLISKVPFVGEIAIEFIGEVPVARTLLSIQKNTEFRKVQDDLRKIEEKINKLEGINLNTKNKIRQIKRSIRQTKQTLGKFKNKLDQHEQDIDSYLIL